MNVKPLPGPMIKHVNYVIFSNKTVRVLKAV
jgi:hypothetical protein